MEKIISRLMEMDSNQLEQIFEALKQRHAQLYPDWEIHIMSIKKDTDRSMQIDRVVALLNGLK